MAALQTIRLHHEGTALVGEIAAPETAGPHAAVLITGVETSSAVAEMNRLSFPICPFLVSAASHRFISR
jgi:hypothetical protein